MKFLNSNPPKGGVQEMLVVALPMVFSMSFDTLLVFANRLFLSKLGPEYMNAALTGGMMELVTIMFFDGIISYSTAMVAQNLGAQKTNRCSLVLTQTVCLAVCCYPLVLLSMPLGHMLFDFFPVDPKQHVLQLQYYNIMIWGSIISLTRQAFACFFIGLGETGVVMKATIFGVVTTLFLSYGFIFGQFGLPRLELIGAPIAVLLGTAVSLAILVIRYFSHSYRERFATNRSWRISRNVIKTLLRKGLPLGTEMFLSMLAFQCLLLIFNAQGLVIATATNVTFNWDAVSVFPLIGMEVGATSLIGRYTGAKDLNLVKKATASGLKLGSMYSIFLAVIFIGIPGILTDFFAPDIITSEWNEARPIAITMIRLAAIYVAVETVLAVYAGALRGSGDTFWVMCCMSILHWSIVVVAAVAFYVFNASVIQAWCAVVFMYVLFPAFMFWRWRSGKWKNII